MGGAGSSGSFFPLSEADLAAEYSEALGASAPLLDLVDALFELQTRGFVWRQVGALGLGGASFVFAILLSSGLDCECLGHAGFCYG